MKRDKYDQIVSLLVRERANWCCERCQDDCAERRGRLHCSHFYSRGGASMRYDMENCSALCVVCHDYMGKHPLEHTEWMMTRLGMKRLETLSQRAHAPYKWTPGEKQAMYKHYQAEAKRLRRLRMDGDRKYLPVENWYTKAKV